MNVTTPFQPGFGTGYNQTITGSGSSQNVTLTAGFGVLRVAVSGTVPASIAYAKGTAATATMTGGPVVLPGATELFSIPPDYDNVAVICTGTGSTVYLSRGEGV